MAQRRAVAARLAERRPRYDDSVKPRGRDPDAMNELTTMASSLGALLKDRKETIAVAESSAGGLISAALLAVPGASAYFLGGGVIYTRAARRVLLRVPD